MSCSPLQSLLHAFETCSGGKRWKERESASLEFVNWISGVGGVGKSIDASNWESVSNLYCRLLETEILSSSESASSGKNASSLTAIQETRFITFSNHWRSVHLVLLANLSSSGAPAKLKKVMVRLFAFISKGLTQSNQKYAHQISFLVTLQANFLKVLECVLSYNSMEPCLPLNSTTIDFSFNICNHLLREVFMKNFAEKTVPLGSPFHRIFALSLKCLARLCASAPILGLRRGWQEDPKLLSQIIKTLASVIINNHRDSFINALAFSTLAHLFTIEMVAMENFNLLDNRNSALEPLMVLAMSMKNNGKIAGHGSFEHLANLVVQLSPWLSKMSTPIMAHITDCMMNHVRENPHISINLFRSRGPIRPSFLKQHFFGLYGHLPFVANSSVKLLSESHSTREEFNLVTIATACASCLYYYHERLNGVDDAWLDFKLTNGKSSIVLYAWSFLALSVATLSPALKKSLNRVLCILRESQFQDHDPAVLFFFSALATRGIDRLGHCSLTEMWLSILQAHGNPCWSICISSIILGDSIISLKNIPAEWNEKSPIEALEVTLASVKRYKRATGIIPSSLKEKAFEYLLNCFSNSFNASLNNLNQICLEFCLIFCNVKVPSTESNVLLPIQRVDHEYLAVVGKKNSCLMNGSIPFKVDLKDTVITVSEEDFSLWIDNLISYLKPELTVNAPLMAYVLSQLVINFNVKLVSVLDRKTALKEFLSSQKKADDWIVFNELVKGEAQSPAFVPCGAFIALLDCAPKAESVQRHEDESEMQVSSIQSDYFAFIPGAFQNVHNSSNNNIDPAFHFGRESRYSSTMSLQILFDGFPKFTESIERLFRLKLLEVNNLSSWIRHTEVLLLGLKKASQSPMFINCVQRGLIAAVEEHKKLAEIETQNQETIWDIAERLIGWLLDLWRKGKLPLPNSQISMAELVVKLRDFNLAERLECDCSLILTEILESDNYESSFVAAVSIKEEPDLFDCSDPFMVTCRKMTCALSILDPSRTCLARRILNYLLSFSGRKDFFIKVADRVRCMFGYESLSLFLLDYLPGLPALTGYDPSQNIDNWEVILAQDKAIKSPDFESKDSSIVPYCLAAQLFASGQPLKKQLINNQIMILKVIKCAYLETQKFGPKEIVDSDKEKEQILSLWQLINPGKLFLSMPNADLFDFLVSLFGKLNCSRSRQSFYLSILELLLFQENCSILKHLKNSHHFLRFLLLSLVRFCVDPLLNNERFSKLAIVVYEEFLGCCPNILPLDDSLLHWSCVLLPSTLKMRAVRSNSSPLNDMFALVFLPDDLFQCLLVTEVQVVEELITRSANHTEDVRYLSLMKIIVSRIESLVKKLTPSHIKLLGLLKGPNASPFSNIISGDETFENVLLSGNLIIHSAYRELFSADYKVAEIALDCFKSFCYKYNQKGSSAEQPLGYFRNSANGQNLFFSIGSFYNLCLSHFTRLLTQPLEESSYGDKRMVSVEEPRSLSWTREFACSLGLSCLGGFPFSRLCTWSCTFSLHCLLSRYFKDLLSKSLRESLDDLDEAFSSKDLELVRIALGLFMRIFNESCSKPGSALMEVISSRISPHLIYEACVRVNAFPEAFFWLEMQVSHDSHIQTLFHGHSLSPLNTFGDGCCSEFVVKAREEYYPHLINCLGESLTEDLFYSLNSNLSLSRTLNRLEHEGKWSQRLAWIMGSSEGKPRGKSELLSTVTRLGFHQNEAFRMRKGVEESIDFGMGWRLGIWDLDEIELLQLDDDERTLIDVNFSFEAKDYFGYKLQQLLCCSNQMDSESYLSNILPLNQLLFRNVHDYKTFSELIHLYQSTIQSNLQLTKNALPSERWMLEFSNSLGDCLLSKDESSLQLKLILGRKRDFIGDLLKEGNYSRALKTLNTLSDFCCKRSTDESALSFMSLDYPRLLTKLLISWDSLDSGLSYLRDFVNGKEEKQAKPSPFLLFDLGTLESASQRMPSLQILNEIFLPAVEKCKSCLEQSTSEPADTHESSYDHLSAGFFELAEFAYREFRALENNELFLRLKQLSERKEDQLKVLKRITSNNVGGNRRESTGAKGAVGGSDLKTIGLLESNMQEDQEELEQWEETMNQFKVTAFIYYCEFLGSTGTGGKYVAKYLTALYRFCALLFEGDDTMVAGGKSALPLCSSSPGRLPSIALSYLEKIPSASFIPLVYQLISKLVANSTVSSILQDFLLKLMTRLAGQHPFHCIYPLLTGSSHAHVQKIISSVFTLKRSSCEIEDVTESVSGIAPQRFRQIYLQSSHLRDSYIEFANWDVCSKTSGGGTLGKGTSPPPPGTIMKIDPKKMSLGRIKDFSSIPVITASVSIDHTCQYPCTSLPCIVSFNPTFQLLGGINLPKVVDCLASDGKVYKQLVKGKDELRQDAIMEQMFSLVNQLLSGEGELAIRTFKIIPLAELSGVIEFVANSQTVGSYVRPAHERLFPSDYSYLKCREIMHREFKKDKNSSLKSKVQVFRHILSKTHPVLQYWFLSSEDSSCSDAFTWLRKRTNYVQSLAVNSILGYTVGLGDRHLQNILLDKGTGEVIHIDLNLIFDQARRLKVPERVPFRLTRDLVAAMGPLGIEGPFRRCCERTMKVMQRHKEILLTILEVFRHDPLCRWSVSTRTLEKLCSLHHPNETATAAKQEEASFVNDQENMVNIASSTGTSEADRVILKVREKLHGIVNGNNLSVSGQVNHLIQLATNEENLASIFPGWEPWF